MIKERKPYSVLGFKVDQIELLLRNLNVHLYDLQELRNGKAGVEIRALERYLDNSRLNFQIFKNLTNNLKEVQDGLV